MPQPQRARNPRREYRCATSAGLRIGLLCSGIALAASGCQTCLQNSRSWPRARVFAGTYQNLRNIELSLPDHPWHFAGAVVDLPFSLVGDVLMVPVQLVARRARDGDDPRGDSEPVTAEESNR